MGAHRLFGDIEQMVSILMHRYWKGVFETLRATVGEERLGEIGATLKKRFRTRQTIETEEDWERIARVVANVARSVRMPCTSIDLEDLKKRHLPYLGQEERTLSGLGKKDAERWLARAKTSLFGAVERMCQSGILQQGYEWDCRECYHTNWNALAGLRPELACEACGRCAAPRVDQPWDFRLHGFLLEALKEHGLLPLVWALNRLQRKAREGFYFLPPHDFFNGYPGEAGTRHEGEADLLCVIDKRVHLVEAKSSVQNVNVLSILNVARQLRPDNVVLAIMEPPSRRNAARIEELRQGLVGTTTDCELLTVRDDDFEDTAYLN